MAEESRLVAGWSSSYDCMRAQINGKTKHAIYKWIVLGTDQTYESQICKNNKKFW